MLKYIFKEGDGPGFLSISVVSSTQEVEIKGEPAEALEEVVVGDGKILKIGSQLDPRI
jgi:hypothetical protein